MSSCPTASGCRRLTDEHARDHEPEPSIPSFARGVGASRRHAHATQLLAAGVHVKAISERLGHSSVAFTMDT